MKHHNKNLWLIIIAAAIIILGGVYFWRKNNAAPGCQEICFSTSGEPDCDIICDNGAAPA